MRLALKELVAGTGLLWLFHTVHKKRLIKKWDGLAQRLCRRYRSFERRHKRLVAKTIWIGL